VADERDEIRSRINIVDLVSERVQLTRKGKNWTGLCPFHQDKNPSFSVSPAVGSYRCWACGEKGDVFTWVMKTQGVDFIGALKILAEKAGVKLSRQGEKRDTTAREAQLGAMSQALSFFRTALLKSEDAMAYCVERGLSQETLSLWEVGYSPDQGTALTVHLQKSGFSLSACRELFLVDADAGGGYYDKFRGRLMFPIRDERGDLVAFGGRILGAGEPKYINSSDTPLYSKSRVLYGLEKARDSLYKSRHAVLTEGYLDVIACHTAGVMGAVASLGTSLTEHHAKLLKRWADKVTILYDADAAGEKAADRALPILAEAGLDVRVALMPKGEDPDTLLRTQGAAAVQTAVERSLSPLDFRLRSIERRLAPESKEFWAAAIEALASCDDPLEPIEHVNRLAGMYPGTRDVVAARKVLSTEISKARRKGKRPTLAGIEETPVQPTPVVEEPLKLDPGERVVFKALMGSFRREDAWTALADDDFMLTQHGRRVREAVINAFPLRAPEGEPVEWLGELEDEQAREWLVEIEMSPYQGLPDKELDDVVERLKAKLRRSELRKRISDRTGGDADLKDIFDNLRKQQGLDESPG